MGKRRTWIGSFVALCTVAIMCYYAVVAGWCGIYVVESLRGSVAQMGKNPFVVQAFNDLDTAGPIELLGKFQH